MAPLPTRCLRWRSTGDWTTTTLTSVNPGVFETRAAQGKSQQTFIVSRPKDTHFQQMPCKEARCRHYAQGWETIVSTGGPQDDYIRRKSGRSFRVIQPDPPTPGLTVFRFDREQTCFREHVKPLDKQEYFGYRKAPGAKVRVHQRPQDWLEHANEEADKTERLIKQG